MYVYVISCHDALLLYPLEPGFSNSHWSHTKSAFLELSDWEFHFLTLDVLYKKWLGWVVYGGLRWLSNTDVWAMAETRHCVCVCEGQGDRGKPHTYQTLHTCITIVRCWCVYINTNQYMCTSMNSLWLTLLTDMRKSHFHCQMVLLSLWKHPWHNCCWPLEFKTM